MPELPEVETTVRGLRKKIIGKTITGLWTDWPKYLKFSKSEAFFKKELLNKTIKSINRRGKNILLNFSDNHILLIHQKLSGHLLVGKWIRNKDPHFKKNLKILGAPWLNQSWIPEKSQGMLADPKNRFIRLILFFKDDDMLALSDLRRFAKIISGPKETILALPDLASLGPDPVDQKFTFEKFRKALNGKKDAIKKLLLDQTVISGIGNIYADESLWRAKIHPLKSVKELKPYELRALFHAIKKILKEAIKSGGTSIDNYRVPQGDKGGYEKYLKVYQQTGKSCSRCQTKIKKIKINLRGTHFCPKCQKLN